MMLNTELISKKYRIFAIISGTLLIISGLAYSVFQLIVYSKIIDMAFISLTIGESLFILFVGNWILGYIIKNRTLFCSTTINPSNPEKNISVCSRLIENFGDFRVKIPILLIWASIMGLLPLLQKYWSKDLTSTILYGIFLFFTNIITAYFCIILISFFIISRKLWDVVKVELWKQENIPANYIFNISKRIAIATSVYLTSSITAWLTSPKVPFGGEIIIIIVFSIVILIGSIILPPIPYISKMTKLKQNALVDIDSKLQREYLHLIETMQTKDNKVLYDNMNLLR